jgi:hypothetical protein
MHQDLSARWPNRRGVPGKLVAPLVLQGSCTPEVVAA